jgi:hypothetical protein
VRGTHDGILQNADDLQTRSYERAGGATSDKYWCCLSENPMGDVPCKCLDKPNLRVEYFQLWRARWGMENAGIGLRVHARVPTAG